MCVLLLLCFLLPPIQGIMHGQNRLHTTSTFIFQRVTVVKFTVSSSPTEDHYLWLKWDSAPPFLNICRCAACIQHKQSSIRSNIFIRRSAHAYMHHNQRANRCCTNPPSDLCNKLVVTHLKRWVLFATYGTCSAALLSTVIISVSKPSRIL